MTNKTVKSPKENVHLANIVTRMVANVRETFIVCCCSAGDASGISLVLIVVIPLGAWTYLAGSNITTIAPTTGQLGTSVTITGTNLLGGGHTITSVTIAGVEATVESFSNNSIVVLAGSSPIATSGSVVRVTADTGAYADLAGAFDYLEESVIAAVTPSSGRQGTLVTITGERLLGGGTQLRLAQVGPDGNASVISANDTVVVVAVDARSAHATTVDILLQADTGATTTAVGAFNVSVVGVVTSTVPRSGQAGTIITVTGTHLLGDGSEITRVEIGDGGDIAISTTITASSNSAVVFRAGPTAANITNGTIRLIADTGAVLDIPSAFSYEPTPSLVSFAPLSAPPYTRINITVADLLQTTRGDTVAAVTVAGVPAVELGPYEATSGVFQARLGDGTAATVGTITVVSSTGATVTSGGNFTYQDAATIDDVAPASGQAGTRLTISGVGVVGSGEPYASGGANVVSVTLAGVEVDAILPHSGANVTVVAGVSLVATVGDVVITTSTGAVTRGVGLWTYLVPGNITALTPDSGQGGTYVTIQGVGLLGYGIAVLQVLVGGVPGTVVSADNTSALVRVGARATGGAAAVVLVSDTGIRTSSTALTFEYLVPGDIADLSPSSGQDGAVVHIFGSSLRGHGQAVVTVTLAGSNATITQQTDFFVLVTAGSQVGNITTGDVVLTADTGAQVSGV